MSLVNTKHSGWRGAAVSLSSFKSVRKALATTAPQGDVLPIESPGLVGEYLLVQYYVRRQLCSLPNCPGLPTLDLGTPSWRVEEAKASALGTPVVGDGAGGSHAHR
ncbi:hypothetical protein E2C01_010978 [Portunus trituberculatus]|uniref:Uncharacterized protein n=1 Tax=Portunus trituberculatus TaxID=210409 RepID=A0A5B7DA59_PORTR|nr:hypothetical protein [Portunus trituberculatus]